MPKDRRDRSVSFDRYRASPFPCSSSRGKRSSPKKSSETEKEVKEWEDARCPVCMEHPHNAVLLLFPQVIFRILLNSTTARRNAPSDTQLSPMVTSEATDVDLHGERSEEGPFTMHTMSCENKTQPKLVCPLCRGQINGWTVVEPARHFMNAKSRSCACETCDFSGTYTDLRKHARLEHPLVRPSEADPERQRNWRRMERQRDLGDLLSTLQSSFGEERFKEQQLVWYLQSQSSTDYQKEVYKTLGESYEAESGSASRDEDNESSDGGSGPWRHARPQRRTTPDNEP
ncbi:hypothetical protein CK203_013299 [Vitis vinifera]|uniref:Uncharacterized protein n=1 Tax=Vitis vinifera TaxID=29760 RepID=A0A438JPM4_VITVI|nr:hypothetical protein CK203_013299 [Vitis vinifera]